MKKIIVTITMTACMLIFAVHDAKSAPFILNQSDTLPVRGFSIEAPQPSGVDAFVKFIKEELVPRGINTLIIRVDFNYEFESHPELREDTSLSKSDVKKIVAICKQSGIHLIPEINLLGHQSWQNKTFKLLAVYPQFDETPWITVPEKWVRPNKDGLYCKSYCPLHPELHKVLFDIIDEVCDVFETDAFHGGMDEVFFIAESKCPRCSGHDPAELFAGEVSKIRNHIAEKGRRLWIWGDRLIDGKLTGMGKYEGSMNNTYRAVDMIPKDVVICDWHYERPDQSAVYFAMKGFSVVTCPWRNPKSALLQLADMYKFRQNSTPEMKGRFLGIATTVWSHPASLLEEFYQKESGKNTDEALESKTIKALFPKP